jgi:hypothetical protein
MGHVPDRVGAHDGATESRGEVAVAREVVVAQAREGRKLDVLPSAGVIEHPVPFLRKVGQPRCRVRARLQERMNDGVRLGDERAEVGEHDRRGSIQRNRHRTRRVREMVAEAVVQRLHRVADRVGIEEVDEHALGRHPHAQLTPRG